MTLEPRSQASLPPPPPAIVDVADPAVQVSPESLDAIDGVLAVLGSLTLPDLPMGATITIVEL
jgi:hypothetical protein